MMFQQGRQCRRRGVRDDRGHRHDVGHAAAGAARRRRSIYDPHAEARSIGDQRARRRADRRDGGVLPREGHGLSAASTGRSRPSRPGTPGGLMVMLAEYGQAVARRGARARDRAWPTATRSRRRLAELASSATRRGIMQWPDSRRVMLPHAGEARDAPRAGRDLPPARPRGDAAQAGRGGERRRSRRARSRKEAILAAYDRFYRGDIAQEFVRGVRAQGGLITERGPRRTGRCTIEEPVEHHATRASTSTSSTAWTQGPAMLQALNILENFDLKAMGYNSARYIHTLYQAMNLAFADRDFYYGDTVLPARGADRGPALEGVRARARASSIDRRANDPNVKPGDPIPFQGDEEPVPRAARALERAEPQTGPSGGGAAMASRDDRGRSTRPSTPARPPSIAADEEGWVVSVTPSGGWVPAVIAGATGIGLTQRMQSFVTGPRARIRSTSRARQAPARRR